MKVAREAGLTVTITKRLTVTTTKRAETAPAGPTVSPSVSPTVPAMDVKLKISDGA